MLGIINKVIMLTLKTNTNNRKSRGAAAGFTIVELVVAISVSSILLASIVGVFLAYLQQYSSASVRNTMNTDIQAALGKINDDVRNGSNALLYNDAPDDNAPTTLVGEYANVPGPTESTDYKNNWRIGPNRLILGQPARDSSGNPIYTDTDNAIGPRNSIIYYVKSGTLYKRTVAGTGNAQPTLTCTSVPEGGCVAKDIKVISGLATDDGVGSFTVKYYNGNGIEIANRAPSCAVSAPGGGCTTPGPDVPDYTAFPTTRLVSVEIKLKSGASGQSVETSNGIKMQFRKEPVLQVAEDDRPFPFSVVAGSGGLKIDQDSGILGYDAAIKGQVSVSYNSFIGSNTLPVNTAIANIGCGTTSNYPIACSSDPISMFWYSHIYGTICTNGQTTKTWSNSSILPGNGGEGLKDPCSVPEVIVPPFNKAAFAAKMTSTATAASQSCNFADKVPKLQPNTKYTGGTLSIDQNCMGEILGDAYIDGDFKVSYSSQWKVAESVTERPIIVVNGLVDMFWGAKILPNSHGIAPYIVSFASSDSACTHSDTCVALDTAKKRKDSAEDVVGFDISYNSTAPSAYLNAPFSAIELFWQLSLGGISAQRIDLDQDAVITLDQ